MAIKYKAIQKTEPGVAGGGKRKWYPQIVPQGERTIEDITKEVEKISTLSGADLLASLYAIVDVCSTKLGDGYTVRLGELGSFRVALRSGNGKDTKGEVGPDCIQSSRIIFYPGSKLKQMLAELKYRKVQK